MSDDGSSQNAGPPSEDLQDLYENAPCGYLSIEPNGRIVKVNLTFAAWLGFSREDLVGKQFLALLNIAGRIFFETHFAPLLRMQGFFNEVALDFLARQGDRLPVLVNATEKRDADGRHIFTRLTIFNATDRRRYERELVTAKGAAEAAQKELEALNREIKDHAGRLQEILATEQETAALREQFIAVLGHDLRNPLASIDAGTRLLLTTPLNDRAVFLVQHMEKSAARMSALINDVLDFARGRLGAGLSLTMSADPSLAETLRQVIVELRTAEPGRTIEADIALQDAVSCDAGRIGQLLSNLLGNALTHGAGNVPIRVKATARDGMFTLSVANDGEPIPPAALERLFQPFFRGEGRPSRQGLGLGLYIVSEIARAHGGTVEAASDAAETRFTFRMPLQRPCSAGEAPARRESDSE